MNPIPDPSVPMPPGPVESTEQVLARLAALPALDYDRVRKGEAEAMGVRVSELDKAREHFIRNRLEEGGKDDLFPHVPLWPEPVAGAALLDEVQAMVRRFIVCEPETSAAVALWIPFTWLVDHVQVAPLAIITAPEKRCGKTQLLDVMGRLSRRPLLASNISPAAVFRVIEAQAPTLLIDEADAFMKENEELRGILNSGHTRTSAYVVRTVGDDHEPRRFSTWGAKALSGIGHLSGTLMDRGIVLTLRRKLPSETVHRLRHADPAEFEALASRLARFAADAAPFIAGARPDLPDALNDRAQDNWEPLLAIADHAGGQWPQRARSAALRLSGVEQDAPSLSSELLADIRDTFETFGVERISTADLLKSLTEDDLRPWATYAHGRPMTPRQLAKRLDEYGIQPRNVRAGYVTFKGFLRVWFEDAFSRYLPTAGGGNIRHTAQSSDGEACSVPGSENDPPQSATGHRPKVASVPDFEKCAGTGNRPATRKPAPLLICDSVPDSAGGAGKDGRARV